MTRDEQRQAWRAYMTAVLSASDFRDYAVDRMAVVADFLLKAEQQRFDTPDHAGDANTMAETRPFAILTEADIAETRSGAAKASLWFDGSTTPRIQTEAQVEPRPWVDLTEAEFTQIVATWYPTQADRVRRTQDLLRVKNGGTR